MNEPGMYSCSTTLMPAATISSRRRRASSAVRHAHALGAEVRQEALRVGRLEEVERLGRLRQVGESAPLPIICVVRHRHAEPLQQHREPRLVLQRSSAALGGTTLMKRRRRRSANSATALFQSSLQAQRKARCESGPLRVRPAAPAGAACRWPRHGAAAAVAGTSVNSGCTRACRDEQMPAMPRRPKARMTPSAVTPPESTTTGRSGSPWADAPAPARREPCSIETAIDGLHGRADQVSFRRLHRARADRPRARQPLHRSCGQCPRQRANS